MAKPEPNLFEKSPVPMLPGLFSAGRSELTLVDTGREAYLSRLALIETARRSIDAQYYFWHPDATGHVLLERVKAAADRGVRVRILLDDFLVEHTDDELAALAAHPNIEVRLFNPSAFGVESKPFRLVDLLVRYPKLEKRMHDKMFVVDGEAAVLGGRNIADPYFGVDLEQNFRDLDVLARGPIVRQAEESFEAFWRDAQTEDVWKRQDGRTGLARLLGLGGDGAGEPPRTPGALPLPARLTVAEARAVLDSFSARSQHCQAALVSDLPAPGGGGEKVPRVAWVMGELAGGCDDLLLTTAYFVPLKPDIASMGESVAGGARLRVLTNSLASNNHAIAHSGYAKERPAVLRAGAELYELRADAALRGRHAEPVVASARLGLHAKAAVFGDRYAFIGTFNFDPRSTTINTELVVVVDDPRFAARLRELLEEDLAPENSWHVFLDPSGDVAWQGLGPDGQPVTVHHEPGASWRRRVAAWWYGLLPLNHKL